MTLVKLVKDEEQQQGEVSPIPSRGRAFVADSLSYTALSTLAGSALDFFAGLNGTGILVSRGVAFSLNAATSGIYGRWREKWFAWTHTDQHSSFLRRCLPDILAFDSYQVPACALGVAVGSFISDEKLDLEKVSDAALYLTAASPILAPIAGWSMDKSRQRLGVKAADGTAYRQNKTSTE